MITTEEQSTSAAIRELLKRQRQCYHSGKTRDVEFRIAALKRLKDTINRLEDDIFDALTNDLQKPRFETYSSEIGMVYEDINLMVKHLKSWAMPHVEPTGITNFPARSYVYPEPYGVSLIIGAWNYPIQLTLVPLVGAVAAGNCAIVKPSELAPATSSVISWIVSEAFESEHVDVVEGGVKTSQQLLKEQFDFLFFTGSPRVGRIVYQEAAKHLTPVVLELGGKSPCIVDDTAGIKLAAKRIAWGKFFNAGQSCVAPDYVLVHRKRKDKLVRALKKQIRSFFGDDPQRSNDLSRIVNDRHFNRLTGLLEGATILHGGRTDAEFRYFEPTLVEVPDDHPLMEEEIFGPILPILTVDSLDEAIERIRRHPNPLSLYVFSDNYDNQQKVINTLNFGGGCINDTVAHVANNRIPFGGIGTSGMGNYHGKHSFEAFSHMKSVMHKVTWPDVPLRYPPYKGKLPLIRKVVN